MNSSLLFQQYQYLLERRVSTKATRSRGSYPIIFAQRLDLSVKKQKKCMQKLDQVENLPFSSFRSAVLAVLNISFAQGTLISIIILTVNDLDLIDRTLQ